MPAKKKQRVAAGKQKQVRINTLMLPEIALPDSLLGKSIKVPGTYWHGRMSAVEKATSYLCTVRDYSLAHKFDANDPRCSPEKAWELMEVGERGTGSLEPGDSSGEIFWMRNTDFLKYYYDTYPEEMPRAPGDTVGGSGCLDLTGGGGGDDEEGGDGDCGGGITDVGAPGASASDRPSVYKFFRLEKDTLIQLGPKTGHYKATYVCIIQTADGEECGCVRTIEHKPGKYGSNTNLHGHIKDNAKKCPLHADALKELDAFNRNKVELPDGSRAPKMNFSEAFPHHVRAAMIRSAGIASARLFVKEEFIEYVRGHAPIAVFPNNLMLNRITACVDALQTEGLVERLKQLEKEYKGQPHVGVQLDMWWDKETHTAHGCIMLTTVAEPGAVWKNAKTHPQLYLKTEILTMAAFPLGRKTGENIKAWFLNELSRAGLKHSSISGVTPDGAADGQCALSLIPELREKVDTCHLHQLQRAVLFAIGMAGAVTRNSYAKTLLSQHARIVQLTRQSGTVSKAVRPCGMRR